MICKIIRLVTGENIAGNVVEETSVYIDVMQPVRIVVAPKGPTSVSVMYTKWDHIANPEAPVRIFKSGIVGVLEPTTDFKETYAETYYEKEEETLSFDDEDDEDDLSNELEEIVNNLQKMASNTNNTYH
jgi:hypothetical protein